MFFVIIKGGYFMKNNFRFLLLAVLVLAFLPAAALAGSACDTGNHTLTMGDFKYPTCTEDGYYMEECTLCDYARLVVNGEALGHDWEQTETHPASCLNEGYIRYECTQCEEFREETFPRTDHTWMDMGTTYPDCTNDGLEKMECSTCGEQWEHKTPALGHSFKFVGTVMKATCTKKGIKEVVCEACGHSEHQETEATGHNYEYVNYIKEPTCTKEGKADAVCKTCGKEATRTVEKLPHAWGEWTVTKRATRTEKGTRSHVCEMCGKKEKQSYEYEGSIINIYTTRGQVNLRKGPSTSKAKVTTVEKKNTLVGEMISAEMDKKGNVWYQVEYKNRKCWIMAEYARAEVTQLEGIVRYPSAGGKELSGYFLSTLEEALLLAEVEGAPFTLSGDEFVTEIELTGEGHTLYGVKIGDKAKTAQKQLEKKGFVLFSDDDYEYTFERVCTPDALSISDKGFDATLTLTLEDGKVTGILLEAYTN